MEKLLETIHANLADDAARLVHADQLQIAGDPRGEFIAVQCELARCGYAVKAASWDWIGDALADPEVAPEHVKKLRAREKQLLAAHADDWLAAEKAVNPLLSTKSLRFERGFVAHLETGAAAGAHATLTKLAAAIPTLDSIELASIVRDAVTELFSWPGFATLRSLAMPAFGVAGLLGVATTTLRDLGLRATNMEADLPVVRELFDWKPFGGLTALEVSGLALTAGDAGKLVARCGPLDELQLRSAKLGAAGAATLAGAKPLAGLRILSLLANGIGPEGARSIVKLPALRALDLRKNRIGAEGAEALADHRSLRTLDLTGNTLGVEGVEALCGGSGLGELRELCLQQTGIDDDALAVLAKSELLGRLTSLSLRSNKITDAGAKALAMSRHAAGLRSINLNNNRIGAAGRKALDESKHLTSVRISLR